MIVLAIDTSHKQGSASLCVDAKAPVTCDFPADSTHLVELGQGVEQLVRDAGIGPEKIDRVALVTGPGSFTGLRIGMSYIKGLVAATSVDVVTVTSLEMLAIAIDEGIVCPLIDARKGEVYTAVYEVRSESPDQKTQSFERMVAEIAPQATDPATFLVSLEDRPTTFVGSWIQANAGTIADVFGGNAQIGAGHRPSTSLLSQMAAALTPLPRHDVLDLEPFYIRSSGAKLQPLKDVRAHD